VSKLNVLYWPASYFSLYSHKACLFQNLNTTKVIPLEHFRKNDENSWLGLCLFLLHVTRRVTACQMRLLKDNLLEIVGMTFVPPEDEDNRELGFFSAAELGRSKTEIWYQFQFERCSDYVRINQI
jgi:hypothetical protein